MTSSARAPAGAFRAPACTVEGQRRAAPGEAARGGEDGGGDGAGRAGGPASGPGGACASCGAGPASRAVRERLG